MDTFLTFGADISINAFETYKKAVYRAPPARFVVDMLPPAKQGSSYSYGMRIIPLTTSIDDRSSIFSSISDRCIDIEYDIYRRWEDCLEFQQMLEEEYRIRAHQKRQRLMNGKNSKSAKSKDSTSSIYSSQQSAASFESLPDGPDVRSIAKDFHQLVPRLTKKASLFRASPATINQRHKEMQAFIESLFHADQPVLIKELLRARNVTDFFGYWRRDHDLVTSKSGFIPPDSISATIQSTYFRDRNASRNSSSFPHGRISISSSTSSFSAGRSSFSSTSSDRPLSTASTSSSSTEKAADIIKKYRRRLSTSSSSSDGSSTASKRLSTSSDEGSVTSSTSSTSSDASVPSIDAVENISRDQDKARKYASGQTLSDYDFKPAGYISQDLSDYEFGAIPEDSEYFRLEDDMTPVPIHVRRPKGSIGDRRGNRACSIYSARPPSTYSSLCDSGRASVPPEGTGVRESWQTSSTVNDLLDRLDISLAEEDEEEPIQDLRTASRDSVSTINAVFSHRSDAESILNGLRGAYTLSSSSRSRESVATFMTTDSANAMFPRDGTRDSVATFMTTDSAMAMFPRVRDSVCSVATVTGPEAVPSRGTERLADVPSSPTRPDSVMALIEECAESSLVDQFPMPWGLAFPSRPATPPVIPVLPLKPIKTDIAEIKHTRRRSRSVSILSSSSEEPAPPVGTLSIKAAYENSIIILRVSNTISLDALKQRLHAKFVKQEGQELSKSFIVANVSPNQSKTLTHTRSPSLASELSVLAESRQLQSINNQADWERCIADAPISKITLRIFDNE